MFPERRSKEMLWNGSGNMEIGVTADCLPRISIELDPDTRVHRLEVEGEGQEQARVILNGESHLLRMN